MRFPFSVFLIVLFCGGPVWASSWGKNNLWDDGRAEVAVYDAERIVYDAPRQFKEQLITVKEDLRADTLVKADEPKKQKVIRAFKLNQIQKFDTENYPYSYLTSVFVKEAPLSSVLKMTVGSQEWCGNTFKIFKQTGDGKSGSLTWYSYFDGEADGAYELQMAADDYFEDQLPLSLRELPFAPGYTKKIRLMETITTNHWKMSVPAEGVLKVVGEEVVRCYAGSIPAWQVAIERKAGGVDYYWFEKAYPHILVRMETQDGRKRLLRARTRWSYWDRRLPKPNILN